MSSISVVSSSSVEVESDSSTEVEGMPVQVQVQVGAERKFMLPNELYKSLLASAVLGKTVLNRNFSCALKELKDLENLKDLKDSKDLKDLKDLKNLKDVKSHGISCTSLPAFPRNLALRASAHEHHEKASFAWSEGGDEGGGGGGGVGAGGTNSSGTATSSGTSSGGLAHWVSVMAEHIHNPHSTSVAAAAAAAHQQQSSPQAPYPWNNGLTSDSQCNTHDKESDYWGGARGAKQGYEAKMNAEHGQMQKGDDQYRGGGGGGGSSSGSPPASLLVVPQPLSIKPSHPSHLNPHLGGGHAHPPRKYQCKMCPQVRDASMK